MKKIGIATMLIAFTALPCIAINQCPLNDVQVNSSSGTGFGTTSSLSGGVYWQAVHYFNSGNYRTVDGGLGRFDCDSNYSWDDLGTFPQTTDYLGVGVNSDASDWLLSEITMWDTANSTTKYATVSIIGNH